MRLTTGQLIALGIGIVFGIPILVALILGHIFGFWTGAVAGIAIFVIVLAIGQRHMGKQAKQQKEIKK